MLEWAMAAIAFVVGVLACLGLAALVLRDPPEELVRTNVDGRAVPAVLGWAVAGGSLAGFTSWIALLYLLHRYLCIAPVGRSCMILYPWPSVVGIFVLVGGMFAVGLWDDRKGDERPRGLQGHLSSLRAGALTGGIVKLVGGTMTAFVAAALLGFPGVAGIFFAGLCIALTANVINLFDRAPGRASKVFLTVAVPLALVGYSSIWLAGAIGAVCAALPLDLRARGMLGDAGANPIGALLGLGLASTFFRSELAFAVLLIVLVALNLASEKWSFSEVIAKNRVLARLDHLGRE